jgi:hypothetical protein
MFWKHPITKKNRFLSVVHATNGISSYFDHLLSKTSTYVPQVPTDTPPIRSSHLGPRVFFLRRRVLFWGLFWHTFAGNGPQPGPKNGLERRVSQFYAICDKNQLLNTNIVKVTAFLVLRSWDAVPLGQVVPLGSGTSCWVSCIWRTSADRDLKMGCIDASRRQLQSAREIRV